ncbi:MAG: hypothetical protein GF313_08010 [Caldithrix sp.]|nr:hypothetical protein [Caldithrix sp.]
MLSAKQSATIALSGLMISIILHLLTVLQIFHITYTPAMVLTAGMLIMWLQSSKFLKAGYQLQPGLNPWKNIFAQLHPLSKYFIYFLFIYALINFVYTMSFEAEKGFIETSLSPVKLRGLSGFWLAFYGMGWAFARGYDKMSGRNNSPGGNHE